MSLVSAHTSHAFALPVWDVSSKEGFIYRSVDGVLSFFGFGLPRNSESAKINREKCKRQHFAQDLRSDLQAEMAQLRPLQKPLGSKTH